LDEIYWGKPVPAWGDPQAQVLIIGLAPAAHGANRTGRMFTGDRSGDFLYGALYRAGFASQSHSMSQDDGLLLSNIYITNVLRCAPPQNKPLLEEIINCRGYLLEELEALKKVKIIIPLGKIAFDTTLKLLEYRKSFTKLPIFSHGAEYTINSYTLIASYHPSQRNTATGLLTRLMFDKVMDRVRRILSIIPEA
jgi:uracil-DNA glycosylase family 4